MNVFEELAEISRPRIETMTVTAFLSCGKKVQYTFIKGTSTKEIQSRLTKLHGTDVWSWE